MVEDSDHPSKYLTSQYPSKFCAIILWYLIFSVIYRGLSYHEWLRAGALYGNLTHDVVLAFLCQMCVSSTNQLRYLLFYQVIVACFSEAGLAHFDPLLLYTLLATQNARLLLRLRSTTPYDA